MTPLTLSHPLGILAAMETSERLHQARGEVVVILSPNTILGGAEAEDEAFMYARRSLTIAPS